MALKSITISIGSNVENRAEEVSRALGWLRRFMPAGVETTPYETPTEAPDGTTAAGTYLNAVVYGTTAFDCAVLESKFKAYERKRGRTPADKAHGKIIIDIDLVEYAGRVVDRQEYDSPHFRRGLSSLGL